MTGEKQVSHPIKILIKRPFYLSFGFQATWRHSGGKTSEAVVAVVAVEAVTTVIAQVHHHWDGVVRPFQPHVMIWGGRFPGLFVHAIFRKLFELIELCQIIVHY